MKAQGDGDPLRISSSLQRFNMFMVSHFLSLPPPPVSPVAVVFFLLQRARP